MAKGLTSFAPLALLIGAGVWAARRPEMVRDRFNDALEFASDTVEPLTDSFERDILPKARRTLRDTSRAAAPLLETAAEYASDWLERGQDVASRAVDWGDEALHDVAERAPRMAKRTRDWLGREIKRDIPQKVGQFMDTKWAKELAVRLDRQEKALHGMNRKLEHASRPRGGGISLGWLLLGAGAFYLYRNPEVAHKALDAIKDYIPASASDHLERAGDAVKDGVDRVSRGANPVEAAKDTASEAGSEIGKAAKGAKAQAEDAVHDAKRGAQKMGEQIGDAAKDVANTAKDTAKDVSRDAPKANA